MLRADKWIGVYKNRSFTVAHSFLGYRKFSCFQIKSKKTTTKNIFGLKIFNFKMIEPLLSKVRKRIVSYLKLNFRPIIS